MKENPIFDTFVPKFSVFTDADLLSESSLPNLVLIKIIDPNIHYSVF